MRERTVQLSKRNEDVRLVLDTCRARLGNAGQGRPYRRRELASVRGLLQDPESNVPFFNTLPGTDRGYRGARAGLVSRLALDGAQLAQQARVAFSFAGAYAMNYKRSGEQAVWTEHCSPCPT